MTARQEMLFTCDRCGVQTHMPLQNSPGGPGMTPPANWMVMVVGFTAVPVHYCVSCTEEFKTFAERR